MSRNRGTPEGIEPCCGIISGPRCMCLPYDDALVITSIVLSIVSVLVSWIWWVSFIISVVGLVLSQLSWCLRQSRNTLYAFAAVAMVSSLVQIGVGIYVLVRLHKSRWCGVFVLMYDDDDNSYYSTDYCHEEIWATIAFISGALSAASSGLMFYFVKSGRHAKWEVKHGGNAETSTATATATATVDVDVELAPTTTSAPVPEFEQPEPQSFTAGGEPMIAVGEILVDKVDSTN